MQVVKRILEFFLLPICVMGLANEDKEKGEKETSEKDTEKETDDSSEDEEQDDSQGDDSEESDDDSQNEEEDSDEEEVDITKQYFTDPTKLDSDPVINKKLQGGFKRMQATFTRKMQGMTATARKAEIFDALGSDPEFRRWIEQRRKSLANGKMRSTRDESDDDESDDTPVTRKTLRQEIREALNPLVLQTENSERDKQERILKKEANQFKKDNPDWEVYKSGILQRLEDNPKLTYQEAYDLETREEDRSERHRREIKDKKNANIHRPNNTGAKNVIKKPGRAKSIADAWERAAKQLGFKE